MATNKVSGPYFPVKVAKAGKSANDPVAVSKLTGVCVNDTDDDGNVIIDTQGVYNLSVYDSGGSGISVGDYIYEDGDGTLSVNSGGTLFGKALEAVGAGATSEIEVRLIQA